MTSTGFTVVIPGERVEEFRGLLARLNQDLSGLAERARDVGYHQERMFLQPNPDGSASLIVALELNEGTGPAELAARLSAYESDFTRWWHHRFQTFLGTAPLASELVLSWDDDQYKS